MDVSIIIVSYNTRKLLQDCLESVFNSTKRINFETIVVDNNSTDGMPDMIRQMYPDVKLLCNKENTGFSFANNQGYKCSTGEYLLFLNSDTLILNNAVEKMILYLRENPQVGILGPKILNSHNQPTRSYMRFMDGKKLFLGSKYLKYFIDVEKYRIHFQKYDYGSVQKVPWVSGAALMIRRKVFEEVGLFDEGYFLYFEDMDLCLQVHEHGYELVYFPFAEIIHLFGGSSGQTPKPLSRIYKNSMAHYFNKNFPGIESLLAILFISCQGVCKNVQKWE